MKRALLAILCVTVAGCATLGRFERSADDIVALINSGNAAELAAATRTPFLLDGELIVLDQDVALFWENAVKAGFRVQTEALEAQPLEPESYRRFAPTMEVRTFFEKYVSERGSIVVLSGGGVRVLLLLDRGKGRITILGFKGPDAL